MLVLVWSLLIYSTWFFLNNLWNLLRVIVLVISHCLCIVSNYLWCFLNFFFNLIQNVFSLIITMLCSFNSSLSFTGFCHIFTFVKWLWKIIGIPLIWSDIKNSNHFHISLWNYLIVLILFQSDWVILVKELLILSIKVTSNSLLLYH